MEFLYFIKDLLYDSLINIYMHKLITFCYYIYALSKTRNWCFYLVFELLFGKTDLIDLWELLILVEIQHTKLAVYFL